MASQPGIFNLQEFTDSGDPAALYRLYTYAPGTTTHKAIYTDAAETTPHTYTSDGLGGLYIALNARGELPAPPFLAAGGYDFVLKNAVGATVRPARRVIGASDASSASDANLRTSEGAGQIGFDVDNAYPRGSVGFNFIQERCLTRDFGGVNDGTAGASLAANAAAYSFAAAWLSGGRKALIVEDGHYKSSDSFALPSTCFGVNIVGAGAQATTMECSDSAKNVMQIPSGATVHTLKVSGLRLVGPGHASGTGHGFFSPAALAIDLFGLWLDDLYVESVPGRGVYVQSMFSSEISRVQTNLTGSHGIDIPGGNTNLLRSCYVHQVMTSGAAGYRIHGGAPTLINCNGVDAGQYWGLFGDTVADDGVLQYCRPILIGCNIEDFSLVGIRNKTGGLELMRTDFVAPSSGTVKAVLIAAGQTVGRLDVDTGFITKGAAWANGFPVHTSENGAPFSSVGSNSSDTLPWWNEAGSVAEVMSTDRIVPIRSARHAYAPKDLYVRGVQRNAYSGSATLAAGTVAVTFSTALPDNLYSISLGGNANETFRWSLKGPAGFTITSSNAASTATVDWFVQLVA